MATLRNTSQGLLILPDQRSVEPGESIEVDASILDYVVVAAWVETGLAAISDDEPQPEPQPEGEPQPKGKKK